MTQTTTALNGDCLSDILNRHSVGFEATPNRAARAVEQEERDD